MVAKSDQLLHLLHTASHLKDPAASLLLAHLSERALASPTWPAVRATAAEIASATGMARNTRYRATKVLQAAGLLRIQPGIGRTTTVFELAVETVQNLSTQDLPSVQNVNTQTAQPLNSQSVQTRQTVQNLSTLNGAQNERVANAHIENARAPVSIDGLYSSTQVKSNDRSTAQPPSEETEEIRRAIILLFPVAHLRPPIAEDGIAGQLEQIGLREFGANSHQVVAALKRGARYREKANAAHIERWGYFVSVVRQNLAAMGLTRKAARKRADPPGPRLGDQPGEKSASAPPISPPPAEKMEPEADRSGLDGMLADLMASTRMP